MKLPGYYSSGQFAKMAQVSIRTIRFYDKQNILKPSYVNPSGARFYTDADFAKLQQILLLKYLGFTLDDIKGMLVDDLDYHFLRNSLNMQKKLVQDRIEQMQLVENAIDETVVALEANHEIDWSRMLGLIHLTGMEKSLMTQYQNASNISARIRLHKDYSTNKQGWFPWIFEELVNAVQQMNQPKHFPDVVSECSSTCSPLHILELGCGNGALWTENFHSIHDNMQIVLSDISEGMIRDARRNIAAFYPTGTDLSNESDDNSHFRFTTFDCHSIPYEENSFDVVIANHVLFYCDSIETVCGEIARVLRPNGFFLCSAYGSSHMREITELVQGFDSRIVLSGEKLYERFGLGNGSRILQDIFPNVALHQYEDEIVLNTAEPLIEYIMSCHGNQNQYLLNRYHDFRAYVERKVKKGFHITKDAGIFICTK